MPTGVPAAIRSSIMRLRSAPSRNFASAEVRRQTMHQQYFGAPDAEKNASNAATLALVTGRNSSGRELDREEAIP